jgi:hypothetical protein
MTTHPYLRAYLAGIFIPTLILPLFLIAFIVLRLVLQVPIPIERGIVFPMALVPIIWGLWNVLWLALNRGTGIPVGVHGAILPFLLVPCGAFMAHSLGVLTFGATSATWFNACSVPYVLIAFGFLAALAAYYLVWKYIVGFINRILGIASW